MKKNLLSIAGVICTLSLSAQNLVVNPDAQSLPRGTGWTIVGAGGSACITTPTATFSNWTMIPDGTASLYPFDHTTGVAGGITFFSGCSAANLGPFELKQDIDVSADAANIDLGTIEYIFGGYIQTPVDNTPGGQKDQGRFIVDYLDGANIVLGTSYNSGWQSNALGSGKLWNSYTNIRMAPAGTRKVRIRMQTQIFANTPAINAYFDDISLTKASVLPVTFISFNGNADGNGIHLSWKIAEELNLSHYELEQSTDGTNFIKIATITAGKMNYSFTDKNPASNADRYYYRLKIVDLDGKYSYSALLPVKASLQQSMALSPNPAKNFVSIKGLAQPGIITIINSNGVAVLTSRTQLNASEINISTLSPGLYIVNFSDGKNMVYKKLVVQ